MKTFLLLKGKHMIDYISVDANQQEPIKMKKDAHFLKADFNLRF